MLNVQRLLAWPMTPSQPVLLLAEGWQLQFAQFVGLGGTPNRSFQGRAHQNIALTKPQLRWAFAGLIFAGSTPSVKPRQRPPLPI
jgi:hypothetical protein